MSLYSLPKIVALMGLILGVASGCTTAATLAPAGGVFRCLFGKIRVHCCRRQHGAVLYQSSADLPRIPASLTKMMTLYLTFEALESGRITKSTLIPVSAHAHRRHRESSGSGQARGIDVDTAIKAIVVKSANDVAAALAEYLGGTEDNLPRK